MQILCIGPLKKWKKELCLQPTPPLSSGEKPPQPFTSWSCMGHGRWPQCWRSGLGSPACRPGFTLLRGKLPQSCLTLGCCLWKSAGPFRAPDPSTSLEEVSAWPWLSVSSSGNLQLFTSGVCSPLYFYFQFGFQRQCMTNPPTLVPSWNSNVLNFYWVK